MNLPDDLAGQLPEHATSEQEWQSAARLVLPRWLPVKLFRCVPGKRKAAGGSWMAGAPVGAADTNGWFTAASACAGRRVELEFKFASKPLTAQQQRWLDAALGDGVFAMVARYEIEHDLVTNLRRVALALRTAAGGGS